MKTFADWFDDPPRIDEIDGAWTDEEIARSEHTEEKP